VALGPLRASGWRYRRCLRRAPVLGGSGITAIGVRLYLAHHLDGLLVDDDVAQLLAARAQLRVAQGHEPRRGLEIVAEPLVVDQEEPGGER
jgi:hypothetical protein